METTKPLEILVVEDKEENIKAAQDYFKTRQDVHLDVATNYDKGLRKLREGMYAFGIFDLELPRAEGSEPEKLGCELAHEATRYAIYWAIITAGIDHHQCRAAFASYYWEGIIDPSEACMNTKEIMREITETPKDNPRSWQRVYEKLIEMTPDVGEMLTSRESYRIALGRPLILSPQIARMMVPGFKG